MNADQIRGRIDVAVGLLTELVGTVLRRPDLEHRGQREQLTGHARASYGNAVAAVVRRAH
jgi:uncharacterized protein YjbJ (UPF0337 family)